MRNMGESSNNKDNFACSEDEDDAQLRCKQIEQRISSLREALGSLLQNVKREKDLWKKELEETLSLEDHLQNYISCCDCDADKAHDYCHRNNYLSSGDSNNVPEIDMIANTVLRNDAVAKAQMHMEMEKYKHKLCEVENMCQAEIQKIKSSVHDLAPLKLIASEWNENNEKGESEPISGFTKNAKIKHEDSP